MVLIIVVLYVKNKFFMAIRKIIIIASAKGGVGKSTLTASLAHYLSKSSLVGILDADIYGTGDAYLTICKELKIDLCILTSSPHELSLIDTKRSFDTLKKLGIEKYLYVINDCINSGLDSIKPILSKDIESFSISFNKDLQVFNFKNMEEQFKDIINYIKNEI
jgi:MinD superfamily P-loop ATPase